MRNPRVLWIYRQLTLVLVPVYMYFINIRVSCYIYYIILSLTCAIIVDSIPHSSMRLRNIYWTPAKPLDSYTNRAITSEAMGTNRILAVDLTLRDWHMHNWDTQTSSCGHPLVHSVEGLATYTHLPHSMHKQHLHGFPDRISWKHSLHVHTLHHIVPFYVLFVVVSQVGKDRLWRKCLVARLDTRHNVSLKFYGGRVCACTEKEKNIRKHETKSCSAKPKYYERS